MHVRPDQVDTFRRAALRAFEDRTYVHLLEYFPHHCSLLGGEQMRRVIRHGWSKAQSHDLTAECCVRSYIDLMCVLGSGFDTDPLLPWAGQILGDRSTSDEVARGDHLYDQAWIYVDSIIPDYRDAGGQPTTARFVNELRKLRELSIDLLTPISIPRFSRELTRWIQSVFPTKCLYVGEEQISNSVATGVASALRYGIEGERGVTVFATLSFVLGHEFDNDPLIPWASATLRNKEINDRKRGDKLYAEAVNFLRRWWDTVPRRES